MTTWQEFDTAFRKAEAAEDFARCASIEREAEKTLSPEDFKTFVMAGNPSFMYDDEEDLTEY